MEQVQPRPHRAELVAELARMEDEFGNAVAMHRTAWTKARERRDHLAEECWQRHPGDGRMVKAELAALLETDESYKRRIADVKFWQAERLALAASVTAIKAMIDARPRPMTLRDGPVIPPQRHG